MISFNRDISSKILGSIKFTPIRVKNIIFQAFNKFPHFLLIQHKTDDLGGEFTHRAPTQWYSVSPSAVKDWE